MSKKSIVMKCIEMNSVTRLKIQVREVGRNSQHARHHREVHCPPPPPDYLAGLVRFSGPGARLLCRR